MAQIPRGTSAAAEGGLAVEAPGPERGAWGMPVAEGWQALAEAKGLEKQKRNAMPATNAEISKRRLRSGYYKKLCKFLDSRSDWAMAHVREGLAAGPWRRLRGAIDRRNRGWYSVPALRSHADELTNQGKTRGIETDTSCVLGR